MNYEIEKTERYTIVKLKEEKLNSLNAPALKSELITLFQSGTVNLILDLEEVLYVDSSGLSAVLIANRLSGENNGVLVLCSLTPHVQKLISISRLDDVLNILGDTAEVIDAIFMHEIEKDLTSEGDVEE